VWNPYTGKPVINLEGHQAGIMRLQVNAEFEQARAVAPHRVRPHDFARSLKTNEGAFCTTRFGSLLAILTWPYLNLAEFCCKILHEKEVQSVAVS
jgi:hypothetical protein